MKVTEDIYEKILELGNEISTVKSLSRILVECDSSDTEIKNSDRRILVNILDEKIVIINQLFNALETYVL